MVQPLPPDPDTSFADAALLIRADANAEIGVGHAMRCLALAEAWIDSGGQVVFASQQLPDAIAARIAATGARIATVGTPGETAALAREIGAQFAVVDGYHLGADEQDALGSTGARLLVIDDRGETATQAADIVLNQNASATPELYPALDAKLLLGLGYVLLRREFRTALPAHHQVPEVARHVLVSFGGADVANLTPVAIEALTPLDGLDVLVLAGMANPYAARLSVPPHARAQIKIVASVDDMAAQMRRSDLAIVAAGSTCWELAACGVPMIAVAVADNQIAVTESLGKLGLGVPLTLDGLDAASLHAMISSLAHDQIWRGHMAQKGREVIDGQGALRVAAALRFAGESS
jgi:UDP-2,4-diacetamido-2,4,6-trideoxy-beta-L-altropyranose hydrolase